MTITNRLDGLAAGAAIKVPCRVATTAAITLTALQTIDGVTVVTGDRVLVKDQADDTENGIWVADTGAWERAKDFDGNLDVVKGTIVTVTNGTTNSNTGWRVTTDNDITIGTSDIVFANGLFDDAAMIYFLQAGTGAIARTVQSRLRDCISVFDFMTTAQIEDVKTGAETLDVTAAIQAAHDASVSLEFFPTVLFPAGIYKFTSLNWSPHVTAEAIGNVRLHTALASGAAINVSTEWGEFTTYTFDSVRNCIFRGAFALVQQNASNTAVAIAYGDPDYATPTYYARHCYIDGMEIDYFKGAIVQFYNNAYLITHENMTHLGNDCPQIKMIDQAAPPVALADAGEKLTWINCVWGGNSTTALASQYLLHVNTINSYDFNFVDCSFDFLLGLVAPGTTATLCTANMLNCHFEWKSTVANGAYLKLANSMTFNIVNGESAPTGTVTPANPYWSEISSGGRLNLTNIKYLLGALSPTVMHTVASGGYVTLDYTPNYLGGGTPAAFVTGAGTIGYSGITMAEDVTYTPAWTSDGAAPVINNGTLTGKYTRIGKTVHCTIRMKVGNTTTFGTGNYSWSLPITAVNNGTYFMGVTQTNDSGTTAFRGMAQIAPGAAVVQVFPMADGVTIYGETVPMTWAYGVNGDAIDIAITYQIP